MLLPPIDSENSTIYGCNQGKTATHHCCWINIEPIKLLNQGIIHLWVHFSKFIFRMNRISTKHNIWKLDIFHWCLVGFSLWYCWRISKKTFLLLELKSLFSEFWWKWSYWPKIGLEIGLHIWNSVSKTKYPKYNPNYFDPISCWIRTTFEDTAAQPRTGSQTGRPDESGLVIHSFY